MDIITNLDNPRQLEKLYRDNKVDFKNVFNSVYPEIKENRTAQIWNERLNFEGEEISWGTTRELTFVIIAAFIAGFIAKIPDLVSIKHDYFYPRNIGFIFFPLLTAYFAWKQKVSAKQFTIAAIIILASAVFINMLPDNAKSDTLILSCIHLPLLMWAVMGYIFTGDNLKNNQRRLDFLKYNGELVVIMAIILISGVLLLGITAGLFKLIGIRVDEFYEKYIVIWGAASVPIIGTYLVQTNPQLVNKVSPVIAKVFTPLVLITLVVYLTAVIYTGKDPYNDRDFLLVFNALLVGVMAIILFSITGTPKDSSGRTNTLMLFLLSIVTIIVNGIALSAIVFRISEWGITPNRLAVLGGNILILINLLIVTYRLYRAVKNRNEIDKVETGIASYLPVYCLWTILVIFIFPLVFNFR